MVRLAPGSGSGAAGDVPALAAPKGQLFWRGPSCPGCPPIPVELQALIRQMARDNLTWGQRRIANAVRLNLGIQLSPRTVRMYMPTSRDLLPIHLVQSHGLQTVG